MKEKGSSHGDNVPDVMKGRRRLGPEDTFTFGCHRDLPCYTKCCHDVNILMTPLDVLRLSRARNMSTTDFLKKHAMVPITKDLHLPVVMLKMAEAGDRPCPFLTDDGCGVYEDRPWSCRMYPVGMAIPPARAGISPEPVYFLFEDDFCDGRGEKNEWTVDTWRADQKIEEREAVEADFKGIVSHPYFIGGRQLDSKRIELFHMASYDLDSFRRFVFESTFLKRFELEDELVEKIRESDEELLRFAFTWLRFALFGEPTMKTREQASQN
jgi:Fe-S-cluster containining protein